MVIYLVSVSSSFGFDSWSGYPNQVKKKIELGTNKVNIEIILYYINLLIILNLIIIKY